MDPKRFYRVIDIPDTLDSEDEKLSDDEDFRNAKFSKVLVRETSSEEEYCNNDNELDIVINETDNSEDNIPLSTLFATNNRINKKKKVKNHYKWEEKYLNVSEEDISFKGSSSLPNTILNFDGISEFFKFFLTDDIVTYITEQTNLYAVQCRPEKPANITMEEINTFIGICIYMSVVHLPSTRSYWSSALNIPAITQAMTCNRFEEIKRYLHFNDNVNQKSCDDPSYDKLFKIRPFLEQVRERYLLVPKEGHLAVDEQIIPTKARSTLKQYNPKKPHKWGYKVFVLSGISGFSYDFDFFSGITQVKPHEPDLGASSNVVIKLSDSIPRNQNYKVFFDNWFTSLQLLVYLSKEGILPLGTVRKNRVTDCDFPKESVMKKKGRGTIIEQGARVDGVDISVVSWYDNKIVNMVSTYIGSRPVSDVQRFCRKAKKHIMIPRPKCVQVYNNYMGGVDLLDSMLGYHRILIRSKKYYLRIFFHFLDMICCNSWLLWRRVLDIKKSDEYLPLSEFKLGLAEILTRSNFTSRKRGRPSGSLQPQLDLKKKKYPFAQMPAQEVRTDDRGHLPLWNEDRQRCKYPQCKAKSQVSCEKCNVTLCLNKDRNCFRSFHLD